MGTSYKHIKAMQQPDTTSCWSTTMSWWTHAIPTIKNYSELEILDMYNNLTGSDGGLHLWGFEMMLKDTIWGMTVRTIKDMTTIGATVKEGMKKGPVVCGYFDPSVGGRHAVALYDADKNGPNIWAMDPNGGQHVKRTMSYFFERCFGNPVVIGYKA